MCVPQADVDLPALALKYELSGGYIRNAVQVRYDRGCAYCMGRGRESGRGRGCPLQQTKADTLLRGYQQQRYDNPCDSQPLQPSAFKPF